MDEFLAMPNPFAKYADNGDAGSDKDDEVAANPREPQESGEMVGKFVEAVKLAMGQSTDSDDEMEWYRSGGKAASSSQRATEPLVIPMSSADSEDTAEEQPMDLKSEEKPKQLKETWWLGDVGDGEENPYARWQDRGPAGPDAGGPSTWRGQRFRSGAMGGYQRWGNSGGANRDYYKAYYRAKGKGKEALKKFVAEVGPPPSSGGSSFHTSKSSSQRIEAKSKGKHKGKVKGKSLA